MQGFDLYPQAWALYIALGLTFLFVIDLKLRKLNFYWRLGILSLLAVGAFTPQTVTDSDSLAPVIIASLLDAEVEGASAIYHGLITLGITWGILFAIILAVRHFISGKKAEPKASSRPEQTQT